MELYEKYRPKVLDELLGNDKVKVRLGKMLADPEFDRGALWIEGNTATGKTTLARIISRMLGAGELDVEEIDSTGLDVTTARKLHERALYKAFGKAHVYIVNEGQTITKAAAQYLLSAVESLMPHEFWIFTSTCSIAKTDSLPFTGLDEQQGQALRSRMTILEMRAVSAEVAGPVLKDIAVKAGRDGQPVEKYIRAFRDNRSNWRAVLKAIDSFEFAAE